MLFRSSHSDRGRSGDSVTVSAVPGPAVSISPDLVARKPTESPVSTSIRNGASGSGMSATLPSDCFTCLFWVGALIDESSGTRRDHLEPAERSTPISRAGVDVDRQTANSYDAHLTCEASEGPATGIVVALVSAHPGGSCAPSLESTSSGAMDSVKNTSTNSRRATVPSDSGAANARRTLGVNPWVHATGKSARRSARSQARARSR